MKHFALLQQIVRRVTDWKTLKKQDHLMHLSGVKYMFRCAKRNQAISALLLKHYPLFNCGINNGLNWSCPYSRINQNEHMVRWNSNRRGLWKSARHLGHRQTNKRRKKKSSTCIVLLPHLRLAQAWEMSQLKWCTVIGICTCRSLPSGGSRLYIWPVVSLQK